MELYHPTEDINGQFILARLLSGQYDDRGLELLFKEWKSYTNLHKFDTEKETICEALIWASLAASAMKRFLAHAAEHLLEVVISTRKASMPSAYDLPKLFRALRYGNGPWYRRAFQE
jgi:hypothetical protein